MELEDSFFELRFDVTRVALKKDRVALLKKVSMVLSQDRIDVDRIFSEEGRLMRLAGKLAHAVGIIFQQNISSERYRHRKR
jgi:hypothetical protein